MMKTYLPCLKSFGLLVNKIKKESANNFGRSYNEVMKETRERYLSNNHKQNIVKEFEPV